MRVYVFVCVCVYVCVCVCVWACVIVDMYFVRLLTDEKLGPLSLNYLYLELVLRPLTEKNELPGVTALTSRRRKYKCNFTFLFS